MNVTEGKVIEKKNHDIVIIRRLPNGDTKRVQHEASKIFIDNNCLMVVDPENEIPREVHCYPLSTIERFVFDYDAMIDGTVTWGY